MNVLYVDRDGLVRFGRLTSRGPEDDNPGQVLVGRGGRKPTPGDFLAFLDPHLPSEDQNAALERAVRAGYRVEQI